jgi:hypothetical protein
VERHCVDIFLCAVKMMTMGILHSMQQDPVSRPPFHVERELAMADIFPATLLLTTTAIRAGIAWLLIERIG